mmetsp:Transcript_9834/g.31174  ORF Transcript_9834/g.31174 Transcript_9834/m.31174 type:complete len:242 (-) Transcript_9834:985-1710(-)
MQCLASLRGSQMLMSLSEHIGSWHSSIILTDAKKPTPRRSSRFSEGHTMCSVTRIRRQSTTSTARRASKPAFSRAEVEAEVVLAECLAGSRLAFPSVVLEAHRVPRSRLAGRAPPALTFVTPTTSLRRSLDRWVAWAVAEVWKRCLAAAVVLAACPDSQLGAVVVKTRPCTFACRARWRSLLRVHTRRTATNACTTTSRATECGRKTRPLTLTSSPAGSPAQRLPRSGVAMYTRTVFRQTW